MKYIEALKLSPGIVVKRDGDPLLVIGEPEPRNLNGIEIVRVTVSDSFGHTHIYLHDELQHNR